MKAYPYVDELLVLVLRVGTSRAEGNSAFLGRYLPPGGRRGMCYASASSTTWRPNGVRHFFRTGRGKLAHLENGWRKEELDPE